MMCGERQGRIHESVAEDDKGCDGARFESWLEVKGANNTSRI